jgi:hypothetical protein
VDRIATLFHSGPAPCRAPQQVGTMPNAIEEMQIERELDGLSRARRAAVLLFSLKPKTRERLCSRLSHSEIGRLFWEMGLSTPASPGVRRRVLTEFCARLRTRRRAGMETASPDGVLSGSQVSPPSARPIGPTR